MQDGAGAKDFGTCRSQWIGGSGTINKRSCYPFWYSDDARNRQGLYPPWLVHPGAAARGVPKCLGAAWHGPVHISPLRTRVSCLIMFQITSGTST